MSDGKSMLEALSKKLMAPRVGSSGTSSASSPRSVGSQPVVQRGRGAFKFDAPTEASSMETVTPSGFTNFTTQATFLNSGAAFRENRVPALSSSASTVSSSPTSTTSTSEAWAQPVLNGNTSTAAPITRSTAPTAAPTTANNNGPSLFGNATQLAVSELTLPSLDFTLTVYRKHAVFSPLPPPPAIRPLLGVPVCSLPGRHHLPPRGPLLFHSALDLLHLPLLLSLE